MKKTIKLLIYCLIVILIYFNLYFILCILKNIFGLDFPIKEHDATNKFILQNNNFFDNIYYKYSITELNKLKDEKYTKSLLTVLPTEIKNLKTITNNYTRPVVIKGLIKDYKCVKKWNIEYLSKNCGTIRVDGFTKSNNKDFLTDQFRNVQVLKNIKFSKACDMIKNNKGIYINNFHSIFLKCKLLQDDLDLSKLEKLFPIKYTNTSQLFFGPKGTGTTLHCAMKSNVFFNIKGKKKWTFIDPKYSKYMKGAISNNGLFVVSKHNYFRDPSILENIPKYEIVLEEGDVLFNPCWWWHCVENLTNYSIGVANRSDLGFSLINSNNNIYTWSTILTRPYQIFKLVFIDNPIDTDVTGK